MRRIICFVSILVAVVCTASCAKESSPDGTATDSRHTLSVNVEAGTFLDTEETKTSMDVVVRASWDGTEKISVINVSTGKLLGGQLEATESGTSVRFSGTVTGSLTTGDKIVYVYPAIEENSSEKDFTQSKADLSAQTYEPDSRKVAFCGYAEDIYSGANGTGSEISRKIAFNLVTSYVHLNMSQLPEEMDVRTVSVSSINDCLFWAIEDGVFAVRKPDTENQGKITVTCTDLRTSSVSGNAIVRFAVPAASPTSGRALAVNDTVHTAYAAGARESSSYYNQLYAHFIPIDALFGEFSVQDGEGKPVRKIHFSKGNLYWDGDSFKFEENQWESAPESIGSWDGSHVSHFYWSAAPSVAYAPVYVDPEISREDVFFTNRPEFKMGSAGAGEYRTLSDAEWQYLFKHYDLKEVSVCGRLGYAIAPGGMTKDDISDSYGDEKAWKVAQDAGIVFLPAAGVRGNVGDVVIVSWTGCFYWSSSTGDDGSVYLENLSDERRGQEAGRGQMGYSIRLITESK